MAGGEDAVSGSSDRLFDWLKEQAESVAVRTQRHEFRRRLETFQSATFAAKPACLSPILSARLGWCNAERNILTCPVCEVVLAVEIPQSPMLGPRVTNGIVAQYRQQLVDAHSDDCPFSNDPIALAHIRPQKGVVSSPTHVASGGKANTAEKGVPVIYASVLPTHSIELMEHPNPENILDVRVRDILKAKLQLTSSRDSDGNIECEGGVRNGARQAALPVGPRLDFSVPAELSSYGAATSAPPTVTAIATATTSSSVSTAAAVTGNDKHSCETGNGDFLSLCAAASGLGTYGDSIDREICLALLGWQARVSDKPGGNVRSILLHSQNSAEEALLKVQCPMCLAERTIDFLSKSTVPGRSSDPLSTSSSDGDKMRPWKRRRPSPPFHPIRSHRYYCPMICGFPSDTVARDEPMWKVVVDRLHKSIRRTEKAALAAILPVATVELDQDDNSDSSTLPKPDVSFDASIDRIRKILRGGLHPTSSDVTPTN